MSPSNAGGWRAAMVFAPLCIAVGACTPGPPAPPQPTACPHLPPKPNGQPPRPPVSGFAQILRPGHWDWADGDYVWVAPYWLVLIDRQRPLWRDGYWEAQGGACIWHQGHFIAPPTIGPGAWTLAPPVGVR